MNGSSVFIWSILWLRNYAYLENRGCIYTYLQCKYNTGVFTTANDQIGRSSHTTHVTDVTANTTRVTDITANASSGRLASIETRVSV